MDECKLVDLGFNGPKYNWTNKRKTKPVFERLDRGWANLDWITSFSNTSFWHLTRITSDRCPVLLELDYRTPPHGPKPFCFEPVWLLDSSFYQFVASKWGKIRRKGSLSEDLELLYHAMTQWNKNTFGNIYQWKNRVNARLKGTQLALANNPSSQYLLRLESQLQESY